MKYTHEKIPLKIQQNPTKITLRVCFLVIPCINPSFIAIIVNLKKHNNDNILGKGTTRNKSQTKEGPYMYVQCTGLGFF